MKHKLKEIFTVIQLVLLIYLAVTTSIKKFSCPKMTETELLLAIPEAVILNFDCK
jgi:hypothetical protein